MDEVSWFSIFCPTDYRNAYLSEATGQQLQLVNQAVLWARRPVSVVLKGSYGSGKTWFAFAMIRELFKYYPNSIWPMYYDSVELDSLLLDALRNENERELMHKCKDADILFIDDLGRERDTERLTQQYFEIFNHRINHDKPMLITTNFTRKQIGEKFNGAFESRLKGKNFAWVEINDKDRRE